MRSAEGLPLASLGACYGAVGDKLAELAPSPLAKSGRLRRHLSLRTSLALRCCVGTGCRDEIIVATSSKICASRTAMRFSRASRNARRRLKRQRPQLAKGTVHAP